MLLAPFLAASLLAFQDEPDLSWFGPRSQQDEIASPLDSLVEELLATQKKRPVGQNAMTWGVLLEGVGEFSEANQVPRLNQLRLRSAQFHATAPLADFGNAWAVADFADGGDGGEFLLREAGAWIPFLSGDFRLRAGKYFADFGIWNAVEPSSFPALNLDGARRALLGGRLALTGLELHHRASPGGMRFSFGIASNVERQDPDSPGNGLSRIADEGRTGIRNWAATCRAEIPWGAQFRVGFGGYFSPGEKANPNSAPAELSNRILEVDLAWANGGLKNSDLAASLELWFRNGEVLASPGVRESGGSGFTLTAARSLGGRWGAGLIASRWSAFGARGNGHHHAAFVEHGLRHGQRLRASFGHVNPGPGEQKFFSVGIQWILEFGEARSSRGF